MFSIHFSYTVFISRHLHDFFTIFTHFTLFTSYTIHTFSTFYHCLHLAISIHTFYTILYHFTPFSHPFTLFTPFHTHSYSSYTQFTQLILRTPIFLFKTQYIILCWKNVINISYFIPCLIKMSMLPIVWVQNIHTVRPPHDFYVHEYIWSWTSSVLCGAYSVNRILHVHPPRISYYHIDNNWINRFLINTDGTFSSSLQQPLDTLLSNTDYSFSNEQPLSIKDDIVTPFDGDKWPMTRDNSVVLITEVYLGLY